MKTHRAPSRGRWVWILLLLLLLGGGAWWFFGAQQPVEVKVWRVTLQQAGPIDDVVLNATGYIVAAHKIEMAPKVSGRAAWVGVDMGDKVKKGQELVRLEDEEFAAQVKQQQGNLDSAKARLAELENGSRPEEIAEAKADLDQEVANTKDMAANLERIRHAVETKAVSQQSLDDAQAAYDKSNARVALQKATYDLSVKGPRQEQIDAQRAAVEQAQGFLDLAKVNLANTVIRAPIDATILDRNVEVGEFVTTGFVGEGGAKGYVMSLADLSYLQVELDISQSDFNKITADSRCSVTTDAYPDRKYDGNVDKVSPQANRQKATILVKVKILNPDDLLRPDMNATVAFIRPVGASGGANGGATQPAAQAVLIPISAVKDGKVMVVEDGKAAARSVKPGASNEGKIRILSGLAEGDLVIIDPPADLVAGRAVNAQE